MDRNNRNRRKGESFEKQFGNFRGGGGGNFRPQREMHKAVCSECKAECEVPFKPTEGKPVFCRDCFRKKKESY